MNQTERDAVKGLIRGLHGAVDILEIFRQVSGGLAQGSADVWNLMTKAEQATPNGQLACKEYNEMKGAVMDIATAQRRLSLAIASLKSVTE